METTYAEPNLFIEERILKRAYDQRRYRLRRVEDFNQSMITRMKNGMGVDGYYYTADAIGNKAFITYKTFKKSLYPSYSVEKRETVAIIVKREQ